MKRAQQWGKNESFSSEVKKKARMYTRTTVQHKQIEKEVNFSSFPKDKVSQAKNIKITKETCYIKKDSLITTQRINQPINSLSKLPWQSMQKQNKTW